MVRVRLSVCAVLICAVAGLASVPAAQALTRAQRSLATLAWGGGGQGKMDCSSANSLCTEVGDTGGLWGNHYVGHDEPSVLFYSGVTGSGNRTTYQLTIPRDPSGPYSNTKSYNFELHPAFWFGMAMCDTFSYPQQVPTCTPDSDTNITDQRTSTKQPGTAFTELQFYPPGWVPQFADSSCSATQWCVALNIDSLSEDPINGTALNPTCQAQVLGGAEYVNFAYLTLNGEPQGPPNPLEFDPVASGQPGPNVLYLNPGDQVTVSMHDSADGLVTTVFDHTTGQTGSMVASAANDFGHIVPNPTGTGCAVKYYNFHPEYSTSSPRTVVPWAAHSYNVAFSDEIGHFNLCTHLNANLGGACDGLEGIPGDQEPADGDDTVCFPADESLRYPATGCVDSNVPGFDGNSYQNDWPDGNRALHPSSVLFTSPTTIGGAKYARAAFETDMPRIEAPDTGGVCDRRTGVGCTNPPPTDDGAPATFYPYFSTVSVGGGGCRWGLGSTLPNTINNFGGSSVTEFSTTPEANTYYVFNGGGATQRIIENYRQILSNNPC